MKTVLFVPGGMEEWQDRDYAAVFKVIEAKGYQPVFVPIQWKRSTIDDWVADLMKVYETYDPRDVILAGFSWGAMTAFVAAARRQPAELWLYSLSPYFSDDQYLLDIKEDAIPRYLGKRRWEAFRRLDFKQLAQKITVKTIIFAGAEELESLRTRCQIAARELADAKLIVIPKAGHKVDDPNYLTAIGGAS